MNPKTHETLPRTPIQDINPITIFSSGKYDFLTHPDGAPALCRSPTLASVTVAERGAGRLAVTVASGSCPSDMPASRLELGAAARRVSAAGAVEAGLDGPDPFAPALGAAALGSGTVGRLRSKRVRQCEGLLYYILWRSFSRPRGRQGAITCPQQHR